MSILDLILSLAGLLLWFGWRAVGIDQGARPKALSLASTLRRAEYTRARSWAPLVLLLGLLLGRSVLYHQLGPAAAWTPSLDLGVVSLHFRADLWSHALLFSFASFAHLLVISHLWLLLLLLAGRRDSAHDTVHAVVRAHFGWFSRLPTLVLLTLVPMMGFGLWFAIRQPSIWLGLMSAPPTTLPTWHQAAAFGLSLFLTWTYPLVALLAAHALNSYLYVGETNWWKSLARSGRNLVRWLPLAIGKLDLAPVVGIAAVLVLSHFAARWLAWFSTGLPVR